jgi:DNA-binding transcriptional ArsR family regulator
MENEIISALVAAKASAKANYLNTGESYTLALILASAAALGTRKINRIGLYEVSTLSRSSVDSHLRVLGKKGFIVRDMDEITVMVGNTEPVRRNSLLNDAERIRREASA